MDDHLNEITKQHSGLLKTEDGFIFRDLNKNGKLDVYEDPRQPIEARVEDLLSQMTLEEKAGLMFHNVIPVGMDGGLFHGTHWLGDYSTTHTVLDLNLNHFIPRQ